LRTVRDARLSIRVNAENPLHHLWRNNGTFWVHYTLNTLDGRIRRMRRSLGTRDAATAIVRRDHLLAQLANGPTGSIADSGTGAVAGTVAGMLAGKVTGHAALHSMETAR